eukprot:6457486-Pyramimonas_sp.AAC.1
MGPGITARSEDVALPDSVAHYSKCPRSVVGLLPLAALFAVSPVDLRLQVPRGEVLIGRRGGVPMRRIPAIPGKRIFVDGEADAPCVLGHHICVGVNSGGCPRIARYRLPRHRLHICDLLDEHGRLLAL